MRRLLMIATIVTFAVAVGALPASSQQASQHAVVAQTVYTTVITNGVRSSRGAGA